MQNTEILLNSYKSTCGISYNVEGLINLFKKICKLPEVTPEGHNKAEIAREKTLSLAPTYQPPFYQSHPQKQACSKGKLQY